MKIDLNQVPEEIRHEMRCILQSFGVEIPESGKVDFNADYDLRQVVQKHCIRIKGAKPKGYDAWHVEYKPTRGYYYKVTYSLQSDDKWDYMYRWSSNRRDITRVDWSEAVMLYASCRCIFLEDLTEDADLHAVVKRLINERIYERFLSSNGDDKVRDKTIVVINGLLIEGFHFNVTPETEEKFKSLFVKIKCDEITNFDPNEDWAGKSEFFIARRGNFYFTNCTENRLEIIESWPISEQDIAREWQEQMLSSLNERREELQAQIIKTRAQLTTLQNDFGRIDRVLKIVRNTTGDMFTAFMNDLRKSPFFQKVELVKKSIVATTTDVWSELDGEKRYIGVFEIHMTINGEFTFKNIRKPKEAEESHPHSWSDSSCIGTFDNALGAALLENDYFTAFMTVYEFLCHVNPRDSSAIFTWKTFPKKRPTDKQVEVGPMHSMYERG